MDAPCLVLDRENEPSYLIERATRLHFTDADFARVKFWTDNAPQPDAPEVVEWARRQSGGCLFIVETLTSFFDSENLDDAKQIEAWMERRLRLTRHGATVVVLHHAGKGDSSADYRNSTGFGAKVANGYLVSNFGSGGLSMVTLKPWKVRAGKKTEIVYDYADGWFTRRTADEARETTADTMLALVRVHPDIKTTEFLRLCQERGIAKAAALSFLSDRSKIRCTKGANNASMHYAIEARETA